MPLFCRKIQVTMRGIRFFHFRNIIHMKSFSRDCFALCSIIMLSNPALGQTSSSFKDYHLPSGNFLSACSQYGENFYRLGDGNTCVKVGGSVSSETRYNSYKYKKKSSDKGSSNRSSKISHQGVLKVESYTPTDIGDMRLIMHIKKDFNK